MPELSTLGRPNREFEKVAAAEQLELCGGSSTDGFCYRIALKNLFQASSTLGKEPVSQRKLAVELQINVRDVKTSPSRTRDDFEPNYRQAQSAERDHERAFHLHANTAPIHPDLAALPSLCPSPPNQYPAPCAPVFLC